MMPWYAASIISVFKAPSGKQAAFPVRESVYLIEAADGDAASCKAHELGKTAKFDDETIDVDHVALTQTYLGVRKVISIANDNHDVHEDPEASPPSHRTEISYFQFTVDSEKRFESLMLGENVEIECEIENRFSGTD